MGADNDFKDIRGMSPSGVVPPGGTHVLLDLYGADALGDLEIVRRICMAAAIATGATIIGENFHHFGEGCGISGVVLLADLICLSIRGQTIRTRSPPLTCTYAVIATRVKRSRSCSKVLVIVAIASLKSDVALAFETLPAIHWKRSLTENHDLETSQRFV